MLCIVVRTSASTSFSAMTSRASLSRRSNSSGENVVPICSPLCWVKTCGTWSRFVFCGADAFAIKSYSPSFIRGQGFCGIVLVHLRPRQNTTSREQPRSREELGCELKQESCTSHRSEERRVGKESRSR